MAGLYQRGVNPNFSNPAMQVAASQGAGGAVPRGASPQIQQQSGLDVSNLGGLLGMLAQQKKAQEDIAPALAAAKQAQAGINNLANPANMAFTPAPSTDGGWGGVQASTLGPGVPAPTGEFQFSGMNNMGLSTTPSMQGFSLPSAGAGQMPGAIANVGGDFMKAGQAATNAAMNAGKTVTELQPQNMLDMLKNGWGAVSGFFSGAGA